MPTDHTDDQIRRVFRSTYERMLESVPAGDMDWPPVHTARPTFQARATPMWVPAAVVLLVAAAFAVGWLAAPDPGGGVADGIQPAPPTTAVAVPDTDGLTYDSPNAAVTAAALEQEPNLVDPTFQMIVIYADERIVDLRVKLNAGDFCHWYGANGRIINDKLQWRAGPADPCQP